MNIKNLLAAFGALALGFAAPIAAQENSEEERAAIAQALQLGEAIYRYDQAAWHTTDAMVESLERPKLELIRGWVINEVDGGLEAVFFRPTQSGYEAVWSGVYTGSKVKSQTAYDPAERPLTSEEAAKAEANNIPRNEKMQRCSQQRFNTVVFPTGKSDSSLYVYYLVPQPTIDSFAFGGHYRYEIRDGEIVDSRPFTNSCLTLSTAANEGDELSSLGISHSLDPTPTEIHVFTMFAARKPVFVITADNETIWQITAPGGVAQIEPVER